MPLWIVSTAGSGMTTHWNQPPSSSRLTRSVPGPPDGAACAWTSMMIVACGNPSFSAILDQARGEKVEVVLAQTNATQPGTLAGTVVGVERQRHAVEANCCSSTFQDLRCQRRSLIRLQTYDCIWL